VSVCSEIVLEQVYPYEIYVIHWYHLKYVMQTHTCTTKYTQQAHEIMSTSWDYFKVCFKYTILHALHNNRLHSLKHVTAHRLVLHRCYEVSALYSIVCTNYLLQMCLSRQNICYYVMLPASVICSLVTPGASAGGSAGTSFD
jgi:hypothetical protein